MFIDSHCHLDRVDLKPYHHSFAEFMGEASAQQISQMLCIAIDLEAYPNMLALVEPYPQIAVSVGVHPNERDGKEPDVAELVALAYHPKVIAIGETGLDYFRTAKPEQEAQQVDWDWQQQRFRNHIKAAKLTHKPLIIHTREARADTLRILQEEGAEHVGGIIHCFTEDWAFC
ncbi:TatD family hydrolase [Methylocucumis oryzae]|uniref:TatD family hydrolase n=1 Tax=Methylocucumis oryzae TaxID=1632867 RepID=UPI000A69CCDC